MKSGKEIVQTDSAKAISEASIRSVNLSVQESARDQKKVPKLKRVNKDAKKSGVVDFRGQKLEPAKKQPKTVNPDHKRQTINVHHIEKNIGENAMETKMANWNSEDETPKNPNVEHIKGES